MVTFIFRMRQWNQWRYGCGSIIGFGSVGGEFTTGTYCILTEPYEIVYQSCVKCQLIP